MIKHRCNQCRTFLGLGEESCKCGWRVSGRRDLWGVKYTDNQRHTRRFGFVTRIEAEQLHAQWLDSLFSPVETQREEHVAVAEAISVYLDYLSGRGSSYYKDVARMLKRLSVVVGSETRLNQVTVAMAREFQRRIVDAGANLSTCDRHVAMAKAMFSYTAPELPNPFKRVKMFHPDNLVIRMLKPEEELRVLEAAQRVSLFRVPWIYHYVLIAMRTGLRKQNIMRLRWDEIDFHQRSLTVRQKGDRRHRVPMASDIQELLRNTPKEAVWVFPNKLTGMPYMDFAKSWRAVKLMARIDPAFRFHDLRHHVASMLIKNTHNPLVVQSVLGHSDIRVTQRYMHAFQDEMANAVETLVKK